MTVDEANHLELKDRLLIDVLERLVKALDRVVDSVRAD